MTHAVILTLPTLTTKLESDLMRLILASETKISARDWLNKFHQGAVNSVDHVFSLIDGNLNAELQSVYAPFFTKPIVFVLGVMRSPNGRPASLPPHVDRARALAINYYLDLGGNQVQTVFYDHQEQASHNTSVNFRYDQVNVVTSYVFAKNIWYAYNVNVVHSVEGITACRYFFSIAFEEDMANYDLVNLRSEYPELISREV